MKTSFMKIFTNSFAFVSFLITVYIVISLVQWYYSVVDREIESVVQTEILADVNQLESLLETYVDENIDDLSLVASYILRAGITRENIVEYLNSQSQVEEFDALYYITPDGVAISADNNTYNFTNNSTFQNAINSSKVEVSDIVFSQKTKNFEYDVAVPMTEGGKLVAVLLSKNTLDDFSEAVEYVIESTGWAFILDLSLNILYTSSDEHKNLSTITEQDIEEIGAENIVIASEDIIKGEGGSFVYYAEGEKKFMAYAPIEHTNWALAVSIFEGDIEAGLADAVSNINSVVLVILLILLVLNIYTYVTRTSLLRSVEKAAYYDALTGLPNELKLKNEMATVLENNQETDYTVLQFDINDFNVINSIYGYDIGDRVLRLIASFKDGINEPSLIVARTGGDKFVMFAVSELFEDIGALTEEFFVSFDKAIPELANHQTSYNCGRYKIERGQINVDEILDKASLAHKMSRNTKGLACCDFDQNFKLMMLMQTELTNKMKAALHNNEFQVYLQPKFNIAENIIIGAEALVRWIESDGNVIYPGEFIPLFEKNGFIVELDQYILKQVCHTLKSWEQKGYGDITISVNCSRLNLADQKYISCIDAIVDSYGVPHEYIEIELTESATIEGEEIIENFFTGLRKAGFKVSIDDFGAGQSSLGMLKNMQANTLKMDRSFFINNKIARRDDMLVDGIIKLAHALDMHVVAEGIETLEQVEWLKTTNCDAVQGYVFAKPMPIPEFEKKYSAMMLKSSIESKKTPLIQHINDTKYANSFVPCGIVIAKLDQLFTIIEANSNYFDTVGYTREEIRDKFNNRGIDIIHPDDRIRVAAYTQDKILNDPDGQVEIICRLLCKDGTYITVQFGGKIVANENGEHLAYLSMIDISLYIDKLYELREEKEFNALVAASTENMFFSYNIERQTIRFSKSFADRHDISEVIDGYSESAVEQNILTAFINILSDNSLEKKTGEISLKPQNGGIVTYFYTCETICDSTDNKYRMVGKLSRSERYN